MINGATVWKMCKVARLVDEKGSVVILKNNVPRYMIVEFSLAAEEQMASDEDVMKQLITDIQSLGIRPDGCIFYVQKNFIWIFLCSKGLHILLLLCRIPESGTIDFQSRNHDPTSTGIPGKRGKYALWLQENRAAGRQGT